MAIKLQKGLVGAYGQLGKLAGEAQKEKERIARLERAAARLQEIQWAKERQVLDHQWNIEAYNRSKSWQIEKMEIASRMDFEREEADRQQKLADVRAKEKAIQESDILSEEEKTLWLAQLRTGLPIASMSLRQPTGSAQMTEMLRTMTTGAPAPEGSRIRVKAPNGQTGTILESEWSMYLERGYKKV